MKAAATGGKSLMLRPKHRVGGIDRVDIGFKIGLHADQNHIAWTPWWCDVASIYRPVKDAVRPCMQLFFSGCRHGS